MPEIAEQELPWADDRELAALNDENSEDGLAKVLERLAEAKIKIAAKAA